MPFAKINGITVHYRVRGSGVPIVFIHPPLLAGNVFNRQLAELSSRFQVIVPDLRGHGQSEGGDRKITYGLLAEDIIGLLDDLEIKKAFICGYSTGGSVALEAMLTYPERFYGGILVSTLSEIGTFRVKSEIWTAVRLTQLRAKGLIAAVIAWGNADRMDTFKRLYGGAVQGQIRSQNEYFNCSLNYNCTNRLHEIEAPVLLLYGEKDSRFRHHVKILHQRLLNNTVRMVKNVAHQIPNKAAKDMNAYIRDWVDRHNPWKAASRELKDRYDAFHIPEESAYEHQPEIQ